MSGIEPVTSADLERVWRDREPQPIELAAGRWMARVEGDMIADLEYAGVPVLRGIRFVVRDHDWRTIPAELCSVSTAVEGDGVRVALRVRNRGFGADLVWEGQLELAADSVSFRVRGEVQQPFMRNRIGIIVLHPADSAGIELTVRHPSGESVTRFPAEIAPHQPARDIEALAWTRGGLRCRVAFSGELFEMEDQRNWTDASFKTYSTPLSLPFPVEVRAGDVIEQAIVVECAPVDAATPEVLLGDAALHTRDGAPMPRIQLGASTAPGPAPARVAAPGIGVLVELDASTTTWQAALDRALADGSPLDARIIASTGEQVDEVLDRLRDIDVSRIGVFDASSHVSEPQLWQALAAGLRERGMHAELVGGTRAHFTELNRTHHRLPADLPALTFSVTPQMHDETRAQLIESLAMQRLVAQQAVDIASGHPVHIGPITLRPRFNAVATSERASNPTSDLVDGYGAHLLPTATDPRQTGHGTAAWVIASASSLATRGVESLTFMESWGPRGIRDASGIHYPVATAIDWLAAIAGWERLSPTGRVRADDGVHVIAARAAGLTVLLANVGPVTATATLDPGLLAAGTVDRLAPPALSVRSEDRAPGRDGLQLVLQPGEIVRVRVPD